MTEARTRTAPQDRSDSGSHHLTRAARGGVLNLVGAAVSGLSAFLLATVVTNGQSKAHAGIFFTTTSLFLLATNIGQLGTNTGLVYFLSRARGTGTLRNASRYMRLGMRPVVLVGFAIAVIMWIWAEPLGSLMSKGSGGDPTLTTAIRWLAPFVPLAAILNVALSGTRGLGTMKANAMLDQLIRPLLQLALVAVAAWWVSPDLMAVFWALPYLPVAIVAWMWWRRMMARATHGEEPDPDYWPRRAFWWFSVPRGLSGIAQVAMQRLDVILVGSLAGIAPAAVYAATTRFLSLGLLSNSAISQAAQPLLGEALGRDDRRAASELYQTTTSWLVIGAWPVYLMLMIYAPTILRIFGSGYGGGRWVLVVLSASMLISAGCGMVSMVLTMTGKTTWNLANILLAFGVNIGLDLWLIPTMGIMGAAIGWSVAILVANAVPLVQVVVVFGLHPFGRGALITMAIAFVCTGLVPFAVSLVLGQGFTSLAVALFLGAVVYLPTLWLTRRHTGLLDLMKGLRWPGRNTYRPAHAAK